MSDDDRRRPWVPEIESEAKLLDHVADVARDAVDGDLHKSEAERALREAADEIADYEPEREEPTQSEPADFGGGESTGVQKL